MMDISGDKWLESASWHQLCFTTLTLALLIIISRCTHGLAVSLNKKTEVGLKYGRLQCDLQHAFAPPEEPFRQRLGFLFGRHALP